MASPLASAPANIGSNFATDVEGRSPGFSDGLALHCAALAECRACGNSDPAAVPIISLARSPRVMLVGQALGKTETLDRRPFAGRAGKTLFRWLARAGLTR